MLSVRQSSGRSSCLQLQCLLLAQPRMHKDSAGGRSPGRASCIQADNTEEGHMHKKRSKSMRAGAAPLPCRRSAAAHAAAAAAGQGWCWHGSATSALHPPVWQLAAASASRACRRQPGCPARTTAGKISSRGGPPINAVSASSAFRHVCASASNARRLVLAV